MTTEILEQQVRPLIGVSFLCYLAAVLLYAAGFRRENAHPFIPGRWLVILGMVFLVGALGVVWQARGQPPLSTVAEFLLAMSVVLGTVSLMLDLARGMRVLTFAAAVACALNVLTALPLMHPTSAASLGTFWSNIHVVVFLGSFTAFEVSFVSSLTYLLLHRLLKRKEGMWVFEFAPSLETTRHVNIVSLALGFLLFTGGLMAGYFYARSMPPSPQWRFDPKILATTATWLAYLVTVVLGAVSAFRSRAFAVFNIVSFLCAIATILTAVLVGGFHRFI